MADTNLGRLVVVVGTNIEQLARGLDESERRVQGFSKRVDDTLRVTGKTLTAVGGSITAFAGLAVKAAADQEKAVTALAQAMRNTGTFTQEALERQLAFAEGLQRVTTFSDDAISSMQAMLVQFGKLSGRDLEQATRATIGLATALGIDLDTAAKRVALGLGGFSSGLGRFGVEIEKGANFQQRLNAVVVEGERAFGLAEAKAGTFTGRMLQLRNNVNELQETIGAVLLPRLIQFVQRLNELILAIDDFARRNPALFSALVSLTSAFGLLALAIGPILVALPGLIIAFKALAPVLATEVGLLSAFLGPIVLVVAQVTALTAVVVGAVFALRNFEDVLGLVSGALRVGLQLALRAVLGLLERLLALLAAIPGPLGRVFTGLRDRVREFRAEVDGTVNESLEDLHDAFALVAEDAKDEFAEVIAVFDRLQKRLQAPLPPIQTPAAATASVATPAARIEPLPPTFLEQIDFAIQTTKEGFNTLFTQIPQQAQTAFSLAQDAVNGFANGLSQFLQQTQARFGATFGTVANFIQNFTVTSANAIANGLGKAIGDIILGVTSAKDAFKQFGAILVETIVRFVAEYAAQLLVAKALSLIFAKFATITAATLTQVWAAPAILATIATLGAAAAAAPIAVAGALAVGAASIAGIQSVVGAANSGGLAEGGIVTKPTIAALAEQGRPEAVIPLDRAGEFGLGGRTVNIERQEISLTINGPKLGRDDANDIADILGELINERLKQVSF